VTKGTLSFYAIDTGPATARYNRTKRNIYLAYPLANRSANVHTEAK